MSEKNTILYGILALLVIGMGYLFYTNYRLEKMLLGSGSIAAQGNLASSTQATALPNFAIGDGGVVTMPIDGTVSSVSANSISIHTAGGTTVPLAIRSNTAVFQDGGPKSSAQYAQELADYNAQVAELSQDPQGNEAKLRAMTIPTPDKETPINLSAIQAGDSVEVQVDRADTGTPKTALKIFRLPTSGSAQ